MDACRQEIDADCEEIRCHKEKIVSNSAEIGTYRREIACYKQEMHSNNAASDGDNKEIGCYMTAIGIYTAGTHYCMLDYVLR